MSWAIETSRGEIGGFGFVFGTSRIHLGDLPAMSVDQFAHYATEIITDSYRRATPDQKQLMQEHISYALESHRSNNSAIRNESPLHFPRHQVMKDFSVEVSEDIPNTIVSQGQMDPEFIREILTQEPNSRRGAQLMNEAEVAFQDAMFGHVIDYSSNPFRVDRQSIAIGNTYFGVPFSHFALFAAMTIAGGHYGWGEEGIPRSANTAMESLQELISS